MGGPGSGRRPGKQVLDGLIRIDLRDIHRKGVLEPGRVSCIHWSRKDQLLSSMIITAAADRITLLYRAQQSGVDDVTQVVAVTYTPCHFGKSRPWLHCPTCNRRVLALYAGLTYFRCRHCYRLTYACRNEGRLDLQFRRVHNARSKLGAPADLMVPIAPRAKWKHRTKYDRLWVEAKTQRKKVFEALDKNLQKIYSRLEA